MKYINIDELFEVTDDEEQKFAEPKNKENSLQVITEAAVTQLLIPIWLIFIALCVFILK